MSLHRRRLRQPALPSIGIGDMPPGVLAKILLGVATEFVPTYAAASYAQVSCRARAVESLSAHRHRQSLQDILTVIAEL
jgi:hypothetical protein